METVEAGEVSVVADRHVLVGTADQAPEGSREIPQGSRVDLNS